MIFRFLFQNCPLYRTDVIEVSASGLELPVCSRQRQSEKFRRVGEAHF